MKRFILVFVIALFLISVNALSKTGNQTTNFPMNSYTMDNGTTAHTILSYSYEDGSNYINGIWRPYSSLFNTIFFGDFWACKTSGTPHAVYTPEIYLPQTRWHNIDGVSGLWRPGEAGWPAGEPVMSDYDTCATFTDQDLIGLQLIRHSMMWNGSEDADYFINGYWLKNTTSSQISNCYVARIIDFDFMGDGDSYLTNVCGTEASTQTVWMRNKLTNPTCWAGIRCLNFTVSGGNYAVRNTLPSSESGVIAFITSGSWFATFGPQELKIIAICGPFTLNAGETKYFSFATAWGTSQEDMNANLDRAKVRYDQSAIRVEPTTLGMIKGLYH
jgi:hypothetical protein